MSRTLALVLSLLFCALLSCDSSPPSKTLRSPATEGCDQDASTCEGETPPGDDDDQCTPDCEGKTCGADGCGGDCGKCSAGLQCEKGDCICAPNCDDRECGSDGCGGSCGTCEDGNVCSLEGKCACIPSCKGKVCGDDGCGGDCGRCKPGRDCADDGERCACVPDCDGRECGDDGCGGSCGDCPSDAPECNTRKGSCVQECEPDCDGRECGDDGCGGSCSDDADENDGCDDNEYCDDDGECQCQPDCEGRQCGDDGCGGSCGDCEHGLACSDEGECSCVPHCGKRQCGHDGCGGSCGNCDDPVDDDDRKWSDLHHDHDAWHEGHDKDHDHDAWNHDHDDWHEKHQYRNNICTWWGECVCIPYCGDRECGDDGCGGDCGRCDRGEFCWAGYCGCTENSCPKGYDCDRGECIRECHATAKDDANCDGKDEDCDGRIDEDYEPTESECKGTCSMHKTQCIDGHVKHYCGGSGKRDDTCNGMDEDCDGRTDEGYKPSNTECGEGACHAYGKLECQDGTPVDTCEPKSSAEVCDGADNDCDDKTDEGLSKATTCGSGACASTGVEGCVNGQMVADTCVAHTSPETCDGVDNDCDDKTDEGLSTAIDCGVGACAAKGTRSCVGGQFTESCTPGAATTETCDRVDNDCDGNTDEGLSSATDCGVGSCASTGVRSCVDGEYTNSCTPGASSDETCDSADNDCDGSTDEDTETFIFCGLGECRRQGSITCVGGMEQESCVPGTPQPEICGNEDDDDCDGVPDEADRDCDPQ